MAELKPCLYCRIKPGKIEITKLSNGRWALTHFCYGYDLQEFDRVISVYAPTKKELIERWNRRASDE